MPANTLPNDVDTLKRMLVLRDETIAKLVAEIARLKRWQYGRSSERMGELMDQLQLALGDLPEAADDLLPLAEAPADAPPPTQPPTNITVLRRRPRAFPTHLPRETIVHAPTACGCPHCGGRLRTLGEDISETLDYVPGYFRVHRHVRPKLACRTCSHIEQVPAPSRPITRGMAIPTFK